MRVRLVAVGLLVFAAFLRLWMAYVAWAGHVTGVSDLFSLMTVIAKIGFVLVGLIVVVAAWLETKDSVSERLFLTVASFIAVLIVFVPA